LRTRLETYMERFPGRYDAKFRSEKKTNPSFSGAALETGDKTLRRNLSTSGHKPTFLATEIFSTTSKMSF